MTNAIKWLAVSSFAAVFSVCQPVAAEKICGDTTLESVAQHDDESLANKLAYEAWRRCAATKYGKDWANFKLAEAAEHKCYDLQPHNKYYYGYAKKIDCGSVGEDLGKYFCIYKAKPCRPE